VDKQHRGLHPDDEGFAEPDVDRDLLKSTFRAAEWYDVVSSARTALGVNVTVVDLATGSTIAGSESAHVCEVMRHAGLGASLSCVAQAERELTPGEAGAVRAVCELGMPCIFSPVRAAGKVACHVMVSGFVNTERERTRMLQRMLLAGVSEPDARAAMEGVPVLDRERSNAVVRLVTSHAELALSSALDDRQRNGRLKEISLLSEVTHDLAPEITAYERIPERALLTAMRLTETSAGSILLLSPGPELMQVAAVAGEADGMHVGDIIDTADTVAGHVALTGRSVLSTGSVTGRPTGRACAGHSSSLCVPLRVGDGIRGVMTVERLGGHALAADDMRLLEAFAEVTTVMLDSAREFRDTNTMLVELIQVNEVAKVLNATLDYDRLADIAIRVLGKTLEFGVGGFVIDSYDEHRGQVMYALDVSRGDLALILDEVAGRPVDVLDGSLRVLPQFAELSEDAEPMHASWTVLAEEIRFKNISAGYLFVASPIPGAFRAHDRRVLAALSAHLSIALENTTLYERLASDFDRTIAALSAMADANERLGHGHTDRVMDYAVAIGLEIGLPLEDVETLRFAGLLHDLGKNGVEEEILIKPSALTEAEREQIRRHSAMGATIVDQIDFLQSIEPVVRYHHECFDGTGYPEGLSGIDIPLLARVLAVADAYESMTGKRPHRKALPVASARLELERGRGAQFDPEVVDAFVAVLDRRAASAATGLFASGAQDGPVLPA
jgi:putative nucleotidyltransferase with HDIG domain